MKKIEILRGGSRDIPYSDNTTVYETKEELLAVTDGNQIPKDTGRWWDENVNFLHLGVYITVENTLILIYKKHHLRYYQILPDEESDIIRCSCAKCGNSWQRQPISVTDTKRVFDFCNKCNKSILTRRTNL